MAGADGIGSTAAFETEEQSREADRGVKVEVEGSGWCLWSMRAAVNEAARGASVGIVKGWDAGCVPNNGSRLRMAQLGTFGLKYGV